MKDWLHLEHNPNDRLGHLAQGCIPVILLRELLFCHAVLRTGRLAIAVLLFVVLGISATDELIEWQTVVWSGEKADAFLGTQLDMACALIGASESLLLLSRIHDRQMQRLAA